jgi:hypothetical protein
MNTLIALFLTIVSAGCALYSLFHFAFVAGL